MRKFYKDIYLVDCENIGYKHYNIDITDNILIYYFTSNNATVGLLKPHEREIYVEHSGRKNALDFVIDTKLGHLLCYYGRKVCFHIISCDKGYDDVCQYWNTQGYYVVRNETIIEKTITDSDYCLRANYDLISSDFSSKEQKKLKNVYISWYRSKHKDYGVLRSQVFRVFKRIGEDGIKTMCDYLYYIGLEDI